MRFSELAIGDRFIISGKNSVKDASLYNWYRKVSAGKAQLIKGIWSAGENEGKIRIINAGVKVIVI